MGEPKPWFKILPNACTAEIECPNEDGSKDVVKIGLLSGEDATLATMWANKCSELDLARQAEKDPAKYAALCQSLLGANATYYAIRLGGGVRLWSFKGADGKPLPVPQSIAGIMRDTGTTPKASAEDVRELTDAITLITKIPVKYKYRIDQGITDLGEA